MGVYFVTKFYFQKVKVLSSIHLNTCKYYVCGVKLETKAMCLHKIRVEKISLFHIKKSAVNDFWQLPVMFQF